MRTYVRLWSSASSSPDSSCWRRWGRRRELLREALALAPEPDRAQVVGEVSGAAQALGIHAGMRVGEALARCPGLRLIPPDPERAARAWEAVLAGAGGDRGRGRAGARRARRTSTPPACAACTAGNVEGVLARARRAVPVPARWGAATSRFCAHAAARAARPGRGGEDRPGRRRTGIPRAAARVAPPRAARGRARTCPGAARHPDAGRAGGAALRRPRRPLRRAGTARDVSWRTA